MATRVRRRQPLARNQESRRRGQLRFQRAVETTPDGEWAIFRDHDRVLVDDIASAGPAEPPESTYRGKHQTRGD